MVKRHLTLSIFTAILSLFYGIIASGQILGFARLYKSFLATPLGLGLAGVAFYIYKRNSNQFLDSFDHKTEVPKNTGLTVAFIISGLLLYILLIFFRSFIGHFHQSQTNYPGMLVYTTFQKRLT